jgi:D-tyrosyl-tRNA(Tyr) deacylase
MKAVIQRVMKASVCVAGEVVGSIQNGLCVLIGISKDDTDKDLEFIVRKILNIRLFKESEESAKWDKSVVDKDFEVLCISQFTLQAVLKGNKPDFHQAMMADKSKEFYDRFLDTIGKMYKKEKIQNGQFGAYMQVSIQNDGPVTILLDSKKPQEKSNQTDETE